MDVHLRDLRYFVTAADDLNMSRAAERLYVSQPAMSKQIRALERSLGLQLFDRTKRQIQLTPAGVALRIPASQLLEGWDRALAAVGEAASTAERVVRVGTLTNIGRALYRGALEHFAKDQPGWRVHLRSFAWDNPTAGLQEGITDAAFLWLPIEAEEIRYEILVTERRFVAMSATHPLAVKSAVSLADIIDEPFAALPAAYGVQARDFWLAGDARGGRPANVAAEPSSPVELVEIVSAGVALMLLAEGNTPIYSQAGVVCLPVCDLAPSHLTVACRRDDSRPAVETFVRACLQAATGRGEPADTNVALTASNL